MQASTSPTETSLSTTAAEKQLKRGRRTTWAIVAAVAVTELVGLAFLPETLDVQARTQALAIVIFAVCSIRMLQGAIVARWALSLFLIVFGVAGAISGIDGPSQTPPWRLVSLAQCAVRIGAAAALHLPSVAAFVEFLWRSRIRTRRSSDGR